MLTTIDIRVAENGSMILARSVRKALGLSGEAKVILTLENDEVRLTPIGHGVARQSALPRARQSGTDDGRVPGGPAGRSGTRRRRPAG